MRELFLLLRLKFLLANLQSIFCNGCGNPVKDELGPHGNDRCITGIVNALRERVVQLERVVSANSERHAEDLSRLEAQHAQ